MKLAQLVPQSSGAVSPYPQASGAQFGTVAQAAGRGLAGAEDAAVGYARQAITARQQLEAAQDKLLSEADAGERMARFEVGLHADDLALRRTVTDPDEYRARREQLVSERRREITEDAKPGTLGILQKRLTPYLATKQMEADHHADRLIFGALTTKLNAELTGRAQLAGEETDEGKWVNQVRQGADRIKGAAFLGPKAQGELLQKWQEDAWDLRARRAADHDPQGFLDDTESGRYRNVKPERLETLRTRAEGKVKTLGAEEARRWEDFYKATEHEAEQERRGVLTGFEARALAGTATIVELDAMKANRTIHTPEEYARFYNAITKKREVPSDPKILQDIDIRLNQPVPQISQSELDARFAKGEINDKDYNERSARRTSRVNHLASEGRAVAGEGRALEAQARARAGEARAIEGHERSLTNEAAVQARRKLDQFFGITGPFDSLSMTPDVKTQHFLASEEFANRVYPDRGGKENPGAVADDILTRMKPARQSALTMSAEKLRASLRFQTPEDLERANAAKQITPAEYDRQRRIFLDIRAQIEKANTAAGEAGKSDVTPSWFGRMFGAGKDTGTMGRKPPGGK